jgi:uncharacterized RDD family membrane protein YckC
MEKKLESGNNNIPGQPVYPRAKPSDRFFAFAVDWVIAMMIPYFLHLGLNGLLSAANLMNQYFMILTVVAVALIPLWYFSYFQYKNQGQTLGKKWNKIRVVDLQGNDVRLSFFFYRTLIAFAPLLVLGYLWMLAYLVVLGKEQRALHDYAIGTQVISLK